LRFHFGVLFVLLQLRDLVLETAHLLLLLLCDLLVGQVFIVIDFSFLLPADQAFDCSAVTTKEDLFLFCASNMANYKPCYCVFFLRLKHLCRLILIKVVQLNLTVLAHNDKVLLLFDHRDLNKRNGSAFSGFRVIDLPQNDSFLSV